MNWPEDIARDLPKPHPEEPAQLRSDILDELYDHLQSSLEREQLTEADTDAARNSVLSRFGNPATIACRLWWDAMWGRIMLQRITLGFVALLCCLSVVMTFMVWQAIENSQQAIENSQQATAALVAQVEKLANRQVVPSEDDRWKYVDWIPVTLKLEYEDGTPVSDRNFKVELSGNKLLGENSQKNKLAEFPNSEGIVDFGLVKPGDLRLEVFSPWDERIEKRMVARPGLPLALTFACPREEKSTEPATIQLQWPENLSREELWYQIQVRENIRQLNGDSWRPDSDHQWSLIIDPEGQTYLCSFEEETYSRRDDASIHTFDPDYLNHLLLGGPFPPPPFHERHSKTLADHFDYVINRSLHVRLGEPIDKLELPSTGVHITTVRVLRKNSLDIESGMTSFNILLPIDLSEQNMVTLDSQNWTYQPSEQIVELVHKRLEQIDDEQKPAEEIKAEAAEVSAETN